MSICLTGGGTLGSVTPLLAIAESLSSEKYFWIGTESGPEKEFIEEARLPFFAIPGMKFRRYFSFATVRELPNLFLAIAKAKKILQEKKPSCVITAGSYVSVPVCYAAKTLGIPYIVLQLDVHVGLANRLIGKRAAHVFSAIKEHANFFKTPVTICGIPISQAFSQSNQVKTNEPIILVMGGGTGSQWINNYLAKNVDALLAHTHIIHLQGNIDRSFSILPKNFLHSYTAYSRVSRKQIAELFNKSKIIVCRAGMGTMADISASGKPAVVVPMPNSHQEENAHYLEAQHAAIISEQKNGHAFLTTKIVQLLHDANAQQQLSVSLQKLLPQNGASIIGEFIRRTYL